MKTIMLRVFSLALLMVSFSSFADKVVITGEPALLESHGDVYVLPDNYTATTTYHYVTIGGQNRVCYLEKQPALDKLGMVTINVESAGTKVQWVCYQYDATYFDMK